VWTNTLCSVRFVSSSILGSLLSFNDCCQYVYFRYFIVTGWIIYFTWLWFVCFNWLYKKQLAKRRTCIVSLSEEFIFKELYFWRYLILQWYQLMEQALLIFVEHMSSLPGFLWDSSYSIFSFMCMFCRSLYVVLHFLYWPLCCLFFFDIRILITPLVRDCIGYITLLVIALIEYVDTSNMTILSMYHEIYKIPNNKSHENLGNMVQKSILHFHNLFLQVVFYMQEVCHSLNNYDGKGNFYFINFINIANIS
jgi:hypothetical protein